MIPENVPRAQRRFAEFIFSLEAINLSIHRLGKRRGSVQLTNDFGTTA